MSRLVRQIREAVQAFSSLRTRPALIGGLALAAHQVVRATRDVDFLVDAVDADQVHELLLNLGYRCVHRSADAANYLRGDEGLDLLYAHRPEARRLLLGAEARDTGMGPLRVVSAEGLIGFKLQAYINDSTRLRDLDDIRALLRANRGHLDMAQVERYLPSSTVTSSCVTSSPTTTAEQRPPPGALTGRVRMPALDPPPLADPIGAWIDLMEAVEALCSHWPDRAPGTDRNFRL
jgi:hypothetical protein